MPTPVILYAAQSVRYLILLALLLLAGLPSPAAAERLAVVDEIACGQEWTQGRRWAIKLQIKDGLRLMTQGGETPTSRSAVDAAFAELLDTTKVDCTRITGTFAVLERRPHFGWAGIKLQQPKGAAWVVLE